MDKEIKDVDWAYLRRFKEENALLITKPFEENRIVFFGDSITAAWKTCDLNFFENNKYINRGINGQTTSQMILRFKPDVIELNPTVVVILAGTNDIAGNTGPTTLEIILENLISMCEMAKTNAVKVILCSLLPANQYPWRSGIAPADKIETLNAMIQQYTTESSILYIDYYTYMVGKKKELRSLYSNDGVHPNQEGYKIMKIIFEQSITNNK